ncbi:hypothetical protein M427DRAFT_451274 [Gonapodya prolifera JEL478]|uniref:Uncharacterized protein n=1 Tax=Gonapodya prolifera (strain JEL478) TaxID=1344416 RepID=A0A139ARV4_GONPJ|nr:hypothetical protein M427DRAFT_451274 [Gonapodya prolifera JEL478]|eukprot:KXS19470.1 hypothetical protein M427DRAFT_451274 [Gonapodya prolifera JEL478]
MEEGTCGYITFVPKSHHPKLKGFLTTAFPALQTLKGRLQRSKNACHAACPVGCGFSTLHSSTQPRPRPRTQPHHVSVKSVLVHPPCAANGTRPGPHRVAVSTETTWKVVLKYVLVDLFGMKSVKGFVVQECTQPGTRGDPREFPLDERVNAFGFDTELPEIEVCKVGALFSEQSCHASTLD